MYSLIRLVYAASGGEYNPQRFNIDQGFPKTGFTGAHFQIAVNGKASDNTKYTWTVDSPWVSVSSDGTVTFNSEGDNNKVTVIATPVSGGKPFGYEFTLQHWFINNGSSTLTAQDTDSWCANQSGGYATPSEQLMTNPAQQAVRNASTGRLWQEWGNMATYSHGWVSNDYWASEEDVNGHRHGVGLGSGYLNSYDPSTPDHSTCVKSL